MTVKKRSLEPIAPPDHPPARWCDLPLPSYRHVPGLTPHPMNSPEGHSMGGIELSLGPAVEELEVSWLECPAYLFGVDLFNQNFYWESHEAWEEVWIGVGKRSLPGRMVQGMIQVAASLLKRHMGSAAGATSNFRKAQVHFDAVFEARGGGNLRNTRYLGVPLEIWRNQVNDYLAGEQLEPPYLVLYP